jgi:uncharacterized protein YjiS (DUF1127 family)
MMKGQKGYVLIQKGARDGSADASFFSTIKRVLLRWLTLYHQRQELARLSDDTLKDIGMSRADIEREVARPFWYDPMKH